VVCHSTAQDFVDLCPAAASRRTQFFAPGSELGPTTISCPRKVHARIFKAGSSGRSQATLYRCPRKVHHSCDYSAHSEGFLDILRIGLQVFLEPMMGVRFLVEASTSNIILPFGTVPGPRRGSDSFQMEHSESAFPGKGLNV